MKSQDILLLLKLVSLGRRISGPNGGAAKGIPDDWRGWAVAAGAEAGPAPAPEDPYALRALAEATGISKSELSGVLRRCMAVGLAKPDRKTGRPQANTKALNEFIAYGLKYVFPARPGPMVRGIPTAHAAPVLSGRLLSGGDDIYVWEDAEGNAKGQRVEPLFKSVPIAVRRDPELYAMLALVDAIRLGQERESALAKKLLEQHLRGTA